MLGFARTPSLLRAHTDAGNGCARAFFGGKQKRRLAPALGVHGQRVLGQAAGAEVKMGVERGHAVPHVDRPNAPTLGGFGSGNQEFNPGATAGKARRRGRRKLDDKGAAAHAVAVALSAAVQAAQRK
jgi:hypothetical protein